MTHRGFLPLMNGDRQFQFVKLESSFDFFSKKNSTKAYSTYWAISIEWVWHDQIHSLVVLKKGTIHLRSSLKSRQWPNSLSSSMLTNLQTANLTFLNVWNLWTRNSLTPVQEVHIFLIEKIIKSIYAEAAWSEAKQSGSGEKEATILDSVMFCVKFWEDHHWTLQCNSLNIRKSRDHLVTMSH